MTGPNTIKIDSVEYIRRDLAQPVSFSDDEPPYSGVMCVETVTKCFVGEVVSVHPQEIVLRDACWVANTGRYHKFIADGSDQNSEFEPCRDGYVIIGRGAIVVAQPYAHGLIREPK